MEPADELRHLLALSNPEDKIRPAGLIIFKVLCQENAIQVLQNCKEVLSVVFLQYEKTWPSEAEWLELLPSWFVQSCAPEQTVEEDEQDVARWQTLSREEQLKELEEEKWSVMEWVSWFDLYEPRYWFWWDAIIKDSKTLFVAVEAIDYPIPYGSLEWLLKVSGAISIEIAPEEMNFEA